MKLVTPVLPDTLPVINRATPPVPMVIVGEPLRMTFPPVDVPAAVADPAFNVTAVDDVLVVSML